MAWWASSGESSELVPIESGDRSVIKNACLHSLGCSACKAILAISSELLALVDIPWDAAEVDSDGEVKWLSHATTLLLQRHGGGLGEAWVSDLIIKEIHDLAEVLIGHWHTVDGSDNHAALHTSGEGLALWVTWVAGRWDDLHGHGALATLAWLVAENAEWALLELHIHAWRGCCGAEWLIGVLRAKALQVTCADPGGDAAASLHWGSWGANEELGRHVASSQGDEHGGENWASAAMMQVASATGERRAREESKRFAFA
eukprot:CAMPEP_0178398038 /NCGR_PEP_ID=MMETSP0689_2-20121128/14569_1 /TAXON_ID=160604 /ORGANISM="Amphidinium massartii, Strain CS-259" /LENGTH=258 /DNA_ID=CAMNT_0020018793 /DNA_START=35 /DNA_END=812 /DNA_ORIENTATION=-